MNRNLRSTRLAAIVLGGLISSSFAAAQTDKKPMHARPAPPAAAPAAPRPTSGASTGEPDKKTASGESFFIVASVDQSKSQFLLKRPTEVTLLLSVDSKTQFFDDAGKPLKISDFRAGDTVWVTSTGGAPPTAIRIRKGQMTVAELHRTYLDFPEIK